MAVAGAGFLLNNEMDDFSAKPGTANGYGLIGGSANAIQAKKRPLSSMTPTIVFDVNGKPSLATGTPGGSTIITIMLQMILNISEFNMGIAEATAAPRFHHQWLPDMAYFENGISSDSLYLLQKWGIIFHLNLVYLVLHKVLLSRARLYWAVLIQEDRVPLQLHKNPRLISIFHIFKFSI